MKRKKSTHSLVAVFLPSNKKFLRADPRALFDTAAAGQVQAAGHRASLVQFDNVSDKYTKNYLRNIEPNLNKRRWRLYGKKVINEKESHRHRRVVFQAR